MKSPQFQALLEHFPDYINSVLQKDAKNKNFYQCPFCGSGTHGTHSTGALAVNFDKKTWFCHSCGESGGMLQLCMKLERLANTKEAFKYLCNLYCRDAGTVQRPPSPAPGNNIDDAPPETIDYTPYFRDCRRNMGKGGYQYLATRGIPARLADKFGIGFDLHWEHPKNAMNDKHYYTPRLIIPLGKYAYLARDTSPEQNKQFAKLKCGQLRDFFFGQKALEDPLCFFIVEGEMDCLSLYTAGASAVALGSVARISRFLQKLTEKRPAGLCLIALDNDEAGKAAAEKLAAGCKKCGFPCRVIPSLSGQYKDPNEFLMKDPDNFKNNVQRILSKIRREAVARYYREYGTAHTVDNLYTNEPCVPTGYPSLDNALLDCGATGYGQNVRGGLLKGRLYVLNAIPGLGKTSFLLQMADQIAKNGNDVLFISLLQTRTELVAKSLSRLTYEAAENGQYKGIPPLTALDFITRYPLKTLGKDQYDMILAIKEQYRNFAKERLFLIEGKPTTQVDEIRDIIQRHIAITGREPVLIIDSIYEMNDNIKRISDMAIREYFNTFTRLRRIARDYNIPVIVSTEAETEDDTTYMIKCFRSDHIEIADCILALSPEGIAEKIAESESKYHALHWEKEIKKTIASCFISPKRKLELIIIKNRDARIGNKIRYVLNCPYNAYKELGETDYPYKNAEQSNDDKHFSADEFCDEFLEDELDEVEELPEDKFNETNEFPGNQDSEESCPSESETKPTC